MDQSVKTMLETVYGLFKAKFQDQMASWDRFLEFIAIDNIPSLLTRLGHKLDWLCNDIEFCKSILKAYDSKALKGDYNDHLGEMYFELIQSHPELSTTGEFYSSKDIEHLIHKLNITKTEKKITVFDPAVGSGKVLMEAHKIAPKAIFFGVESDLRLLRIAMTNFAIHEIEGYFLHADRTEHELDISTLGGQYNWQFANSLDSHIHKLKPKSGLIQTPLQTP
ncbi:MAG: N-6 DNA methylase [Candidatus Zixiibacteriota bacterium]